MCTLYFFTIPNYIVLAPYIGTFSKHQNKAN